MQQLFSFHAPLIVHLRAAIVAGSTGRMIMLLFIYASPAIGLPRIDIVSLLGSLAARSKQDAVTLGGAIHFSMGVFFAIIYSALWSIGIGSATWWWGFIFGAVHGIIVILMLLFVKRRFMLLFEQFNSFLLLFPILVSHIIFGVVVAIVYTN